MPRFDLRAADVAFVAILIGAAGAVHSRWENAVASVVTGALLVCAATVAWASAWTSEWISRYHLTHYDSLRHSLVRPQRKAGHNVVCPYPDAWYASALTLELPPGTVRPIVVCNQNLVVFRPELKAGETTWPAPAILDAYCTHLGAHLAMGGGTVVGDCIRCPFHAWCFDTTGKLTSTTTGDLPPGSDIRSWPVLERNGIISVWMSSTVHKDPAILRQTVRPVKGGAECAAAAAPAAGKDKGEHTHGAAELAAAAGTAAAVPRNTPWFEIPAFPELNSADGPGGATGLTYHGCTENIVASVLQEMPENGADVAHLNALHAEFAVQALYPFLSHKWEANWRVREAAPHLADMDVKEYIVLARWLTLPGEVSVHITQCGPSQVFIDLLTPVGRVLVLETVSPVSPRQQRVMHGLYAGPTVPRLFAKAILWMTMAQYEKDVPVWCNKVFHPKPSLAKHDPAIGEYRRWARKFVQPGAITYVEAMKAHIADSLGMPAETGLEW
jgi:cholesterol 7-dehydrogenase